MEIREILDWYNIRAKLGAPCSYKGNKALEEHLVCESLIKIYRGEGIETFPFLSLEPFKKGPYVETVIYPKGHLFVSFKEVPFSINSEKLKKSLYDNFCFSKDHKIGFLVLSWNKDTPQCRTDRNFRKNYISIEAYDKGKCLYININGDEGTYEMSYGYSDNWGKSTLKSILKLRDIIEKEIIY